MLECGRSAEADKAVDLRLFKISIKTAKACQEHNIPSLALKVLERSAIHQDRLANVSANEGIDLVRLAALRSDYFLCRAALV